MFVCVKKSVLGFRFRLEFRYLVRPHVLCVGVALFFWLGTGCRVCCYRLSMRLLGCLRCCCRLGLVRLGGRLLWLVCRTMRRGVGLLVGVCGCVGIRGLSMRSWGLTRFACPSASLSLVAYGWHVVAHVSGLSLLFVFCLCVLIVSVGQMRTAPGSHSV